MIIFPTPKHFLTKTNHLKDEIDFNEYGVLIAEKDVMNVDRILKKYTTEDIANLQKNGERVYTEYFLYESCYDKIIRKLENETNQHSNSHV